MHIVEIIKQAISIKNNIVLFKEPIQTNHNLMMEPVIADDLSSIKMELVKTESPTKIAKIDIQIDDYNGHLIDAIIKPDTAPPKADNAQTKEQATIPPETSEIVPVTRSDAVSFIRFAYDRLKEGRHIRFYKTDIYNGLVMKLFDNQGRMIRDGRTISMDIRNQKSKNYRDRHIIIDKAIISCYHLTGDEIDQVSKFIDTPIGCAQSNEFYREMITLPK